MASGTSMRSKSSEETFDYTCSLCRKKNKVVEAVKYCQECHKHLCTSCLEQHNHFMEDHALVEPSAAGSVVVMPTDRCKKHGGEIVKLWCKQHDEVLCNTCVTIDHRSCGEVKFIPGETDTLLQDSELHQTIGDMKRARERLASLKKDRSIAGEELLREKNKYLDMIDRYQRMIIQKVESLGKAARNEIDGWYEENNGKINENQEGCDQLENDTIACISQMETSAENKSQMFVSMKKGQKLLATIGGFVGQGAFKWIAENRFEINRDLEWYLDGLKSLGSLKKHSTPYKVSGTIKVNVKVDKDSSVCHIFDSCLLSDGSVLMTDFNNKKLKRLDSSAFTVTDTCDLPESPRGVCCVGPKEVAVCQKGMGIQFVSVDNTMTLSKSFEVNHNCCGIGYSDGEFFVTDAGNIVYVYDVSGALLRTIRRDQTGEEMFLTTRCITISGDKIYTADFGRSFVCIDRNGTELYRCMGTQVKKGHGVCTDGQGGVFLSGFSSTNVVQIGADGQELGVVLTKADGLVNPLSVLFNTNTQQLVVTNFNKDEIVVAQLT